MSTTLLERPAAVLERPLARPPAPTAITVAVGRAGRHGVEAARQAHALRSGKTLRG